MSLPILAGIGVVALALIVVLASRRSGPRVTTIETRREERDGQGE